MAEMLIVWLVVPVALLLLCFGLGLFITLLTRKPMSATITVAFGFIFITIFGSLLVISSASARFTAPIIGILGFVTLAFVLLRKRDYIRFDHLSNFAASISFVVYGLPVIAYGAPSWPGWVKLDDQATFLVVIDRLMSFGRTVPSPVNSTYQRVIQTMFEDSSGGHYSYPVGSLMPLGVISKITGVEAAWIFQPYLSILAALTAALFVVVLRSHFKSKLVVFFISVVSILSSTLYSYAMWGAIKEFAILIPITIFGVMIFAAIKSKNSTTYFFFAGLSLASMFFVGGNAALGFALPVIFIALLVKFPIKNRLVISGILSFALLGVVGITYYLRAAHNPIATLLIPIIGDQGNMVRPLHLGQVVGVWPAPDFRMESLYPSATYFLIALGLFFAVVGAYFSVRRRLWVVPTLLGTVLAVMLNSHFWGGIWLTGKATAIASPFLLLAAGVGMFELYSKIKLSSFKYLKDFDYHFVVAAIALLFGFSVLGSDVITYKNVWLAPNSQLIDLEKIGQLFKGQGPTLMTEYSVFGSRYFLRKSDAEAVSELRVHEIPTRDGQQVPKGFAGDIDLFDNATIDYFQLLVLRKSPNSSRPPLNYSLAYSGTHYEVWKKTATKLKIKATLPLGNVFFPGRQPSCEVVKTFLSQRVPGDRIYTALRDPIYIVDFGSGDLPPGWIPVVPASGAVDRDSNGEFSRNFVLGATAEYGFYLAGTFPGTVKVLIDGQQIFSGHSTFEANPYLTNPLGSVSLTGGIHTISVKYDASILAPGADASSRFGPIYLSTQVAGDVRVHAVRASEIPSLCKQNLDWIAIAR